MDSLFCLWFFMNPDIKSLPLSTLIQGCPETGCHDPPPPLRPTVHLFLPSRLHLSIFLNGASQQLKIASSADLVEKPRHFPWVLKQQLHWVFLIFIDFLFCFSLSLQPLPQPSSSHTTISSTVLQIICLTLTMRFIKTSAKL